MFLFSCISFFSPPAMVFIILLCVKSSPAISLTSLAIAHSDYTGAGNEGRSKVPLRMVGNHLKSAKAEGSLTATPTGGAGTKVGLSDPVV